MAIRTEPYTKVREVIKKAPATLEVDNNSDIGLVIVSPYGRRLARITGPDKFLKEYTIDGVTIPRDADITLINAYYMSYFASLVISRSVNTTATKGLMFYSIEDSDTRYIDTKEVWYKDGKFLNYNSKWIFSILPQQNDGAFAMVINETVYYSNITKDDLVIMYPEYSKYQSFIALSDYFTGISNTITGEEFVESLSEFKSSLYANLDLLEEVNPAEVSFKYYGIPINSNNQPEQEVTALELANGDALLTRIGVSIDLYYTVGQVKIPGDIDVQCGGTSDTSRDTSDDVISGPNYVDPEYMDSDGDIIIDINVAAVDAKELFGIYTSNNAITNYLKVTLDTSAGDDTFGVIFEGDVYQVSLNPEATDSNEANIYIDYLNTLGIPFTVDVRYNDQTKYEYNPYEFGNYNDTAANRFGGGVNADEMGKTPYLLKAADALADQDQYELPYYALAGCTRLQFVKRMSYIADNNLGYLPIDAPKEYLTVGMMKRYFTALGISSSHVEAMGPFDRNQSLTGWINYIAASTLWYERLMRNKANNDEFAPIYKEGYGVLLYTDPVKILTKPQREELLNLASPVNYINFNNRTNNYYLNDNWTHQRADDVMSEDQNRRLVNKINRDIKRNMDQFITRQNNAATRSQVVDMVNNYFQTEIMTKNYPPEAYEVICNSKNNGEEIGRAKQLKLKIRCRLYNTIKYIDVLNEVYPIGVEFGK